MDTPSTRRLHLPRHEPHPRIRELRTQGWTDAQIAAAIGASPRAVVRWAAGDTRPLPVYEANLARLPSAPAARVAATPSLPNEEKTP
jgi:transcriptional regulator with XRE-family HTH domain